MSDTTAPANDKDTDGRQVFRSPVAVVVWWVWVLFAAANLIDLAVQGRDHLSLTAACILLFVTGIMYVTAKRPRIVADTDALTIVNPLRDHHVGWAAVAGADPADLLRVRCEWPEGDRTARRAIYSWAVHSSRRQRVAAEMRSRRKGRQPGSPRFGGAVGSGATGAFGTPARPALEADPLRVDATRVVAVLTGRAERARQDAQGPQATAPASTWDWTAVAAVVVPGLALLVTALA